MPYALKGPLAVHAEGTGIMDAIHMWSSCQKTHSNDLYAACINEQGESALVSWRQSACGLHDKRHTAMTFMVHAAMSKGKVVEVEQHVNLLSKEKTLDCHTNTEPLQCMQR